MADAKISDLLEITTAAPGDQIVIVDIDAAPQTTKKIQVQNLVRLPAFVGSRLNTNQATGSVNGVWLTLSFNSDFASLLNGYVDRPTATRFRALVAGWYRITYEIYSVPDGNDKGVQFRVIKDGVATALSGGDSRAHGKNGVNTPGLAVKTLTVLLTANEYLEIQAAPLDGTFCTLQAYSNATFEYLVST